MTPRFASAVVTAVLLAAACSGDDTADRADASTTTAAGDPSPTRSVTAGGVQVTVAPGPHSVLTAEVHVTGPGPTRPRLVATGSDGHRVEVPPPDRARRRHRIPLVGLRAETDYDLALSGDPAFADLDGELRFHTGSLPDDLPPVEAVVEGEPRPGATLFNATPSDLGVPRPGNLVAVDHEGEVVWYHQDVQNVADVRQLPNGNLLYNSGNIGAREIDVLGNVVRDWTTRPRVRAGRLDPIGRPTHVPGAVVLETPRLHHEVSQPLPNGNFLSLSMEVRTYRGFDDPGCGPEPFADPTVRPQRGDVVVEYTPEGEVVHQVSLLDAIDPVADPGFQQCNLKTDEVVLGDDRVFVDWSHANSAELFEDENVVLVSARNLNSVMALRWRTDAEGPAGELLWQLGPDHDFRLTEGEWFYRQHAPEVQPDGTILIYDNGSQRPGSEGGKVRPYSRAVLYELDRSGPPSTWTARQVWEHRIDTPEGPVFADFLGDADSIGGGHVLITHGAVVDDGTGLNSALIVEVDRSTDETLLSIEVPAGDDLGWQTYRAEHLDTWYPDPVDLPLVGDPPLP